MIIINTQRFTFVRVPKCAGTTIRHPLQAFDDCNGAHTARVADQLLLEQRYPCG